MIHLVSDRHPNGDVYRIVDAEGHPFHSVGDFLASLRIRGLSPRTTRAYAFDLLSLFRWQATIAKNVTDLDAKDLLAFIAAQQQSGASPATINRRITTACVFVRFLTGKDIADTAGGRTSPYYKGRGRDRQLGLHALPRRPPRLRVKSPRRLVEPLTAAEVHEFFRRLSRYRDLGIAYLLLLCGLRSCEILATRRGDALLCEQRLLIRGKGRKERALPLPAIIVDTLTRYLRVERPQTIHDHLFVVLQGKRRGLPMTEGGLRNIFRYRRKDPLLARANAHRFRHTFGADMARAGVRLPVLQKMMGHANGATTLHYINLSMEDIADAYTQVMSVIAKRYDETLMRTF